MENVIGYPQRPDLDELHLSVEETRLFLAVLCLSSSAVAHKRWQLELAQFICSRDQSLLGPDLVGFDMGEIPWVRQEPLAPQKGFLEKVVDLAERRTGWEKLGIFPDEKRLMRRLAVLRGLLDAMEVRHIVDPDPTHAVLLPAEHHYCKLHRVLTHRYGCLLCNNKA